MKLGSKSLFRLLLIICCITLRTEAVAAVDRFELQLKWVPQAQFMGFYIADSLGYYRQEQLEVILHPGSEDLSLAELLARGQVDAAVEWMPPALVARERGAPIINVAQLFQHSGLLLICHRERGIERPSDLKNKHLGTWFNGSEIAVNAWLDAIGIPTDTADGAKVMPQGEALDEWRKGTLDCVSAMTYNERWILIRAGISLSDMTIFSLEESGFGILEDGLYVAESRLSDPAFQDQLLRFLKASLRGWRYAMERPIEAVDLLVQRFPDLDRHHQLRMMEEVNHLLGELETVGMIHLDAYDRVVDMLWRSDAEHHILEAEPTRAWTHELWERAHNKSSIFSLEVRYRLDQILTSPVFYFIDLIGTLAFGIMGFSRAQSRRYDIWGALVLTSLPAVGGGTIRDILVGGDRHPPFILNDPAYLYVVFSIVIVGTLLTRFSHDQPISERFPRIMSVIDTIGFAAFCIIGAKVAILAQLSWFWIPCLAAVTCAGGGVLLDIVTGEEPRTFRGIIYEEVAIGGGLFLSGLLYLSNFSSNVEFHITLSIGLTMLLVFVLRMLVITRGWQALRLTRRSAP